MNKLPKDNLILQPAFLFTYAGILGYIIFFLLRPSFDFNSGAPISYSAEDAIRLTHELNSSLGFESDSLPAMVVRFQNLSLNNILKESQADAAGGGTISPHQLNRSGVPINGWRVTVGNVYEEPALIQGDIQLYRDVGIVQTRIGPDGRFQTVTTQQNQSPYLVPATRDFRDAASVITDIFEYPLTNYHRDIPETEQDTLRPETDDIPSLTGDDLPDSGTLLFRKNTPTIAGPTTLELTYTFVEAPGDDQQELLRIDSFRASYLPDSDSQVSSGSFNDEIWGRTVFILVIIILIIIVFSTGLRQIFRGRVEWKRAFFLFVAVTAGQLIWTLPYLHSSYYRFLEGTIIWLDHLQQIFLASTYGLYAAMAYIAWESLARELKSGQIPVIDAVWSGRLIQKQVGAGILSGYGIAGFCLGILAVYLYSFQTVLVQYDSVFGLRDIATGFPSLFITLNAWLTSLVIIIPQIGVVYCLMSVLSKREPVRLISSILLAGFTLFSTGYFLQTGMTELQSLILYTAIAIPLVLAYRYFGIISAIITWFVLLLTVRVLPLLGSSNPEITMHASIIGVVFVAPLLLGLVGIRYGKSMTASAAFAPKYEEQRNKQLRAEKEIAIAKESQFALMPTSAPDLPGYDIRGFFVPSHDVGGDFYDYTIIHNERGEPDAVAVAIVDVSGKAMKSAFNAVFTSGLLLSRISTDSPEQILRAVNPIIFKKTDSQTFITCQIGRIDLKSKVLKLSNAGHCKPMLKRNGEVRFIDTSEPRYPLGLRSNVQYTSVEVQLQKGDILLFYSDGLPEAKSPDGKRLEFEDVKQLLQDQETQQSNSRQICESIQRFILEFSNYELADDTTVVCVKVE